MLQTGQSGRDGLLAVTPHIGGGAEDVAALGRRQAQPPRPPRDDIPDVTVVEGLGLTAVGLEGPRVPLYERRRAALQVDPQLDILRASDGPREEAHDAGIEAYLDNPPDPAAGEGRGVPCAAGGSIARGKAQLEAEEGLIRGDVDGGAEPDLDIRPAVQVVTAGGVEEADPRVGWTGDLDAPAWGGWLRLGNLGDDDLAAFVAIQVRSIQEGRCGVRGQRMAYLAARRRRMCASS